MALVVLDRQEYTNKAMDLLGDGDTYRPLTSDTTHKHKNNLINILRTIKAEGGLGIITHNRLYPTGAGFSEFYGLLKIHKKTSSLNP